jgi:hypothetical protein
MTYRDRPFSYSHQQAPMDMARETGTYQACAFIYVKKRECDRSCATPRLEVDENLEQPG